MDDNRYRASDMALVTYLRLCGFEIQKIAMEAATNSCYWFFINSSSLAAEVDAYLSDEAMCNPREFNREFSRTRNELHAANVPD